MRDIDRDRLALILSLGGHAVIIALLLFLHLPPPELPGLPKSISISMLPPEADTSSTSAQSVAGLPNQPSSPAPQIQQAASLPAPPMQPQQPSRPAAAPASPAPAATTASSDAFPSADLLKPFDPNIQSDRANIAAMPSPSLKLAAPIGSGEGSAGHGTLDYEAVTVEIDGGLPLDEQHFFFERLTQCGLSGVKSDDKSWLVIVRVLFEPTGRLAKAQVVNRPAQPSDAYNTAEARLMGALSSPGCAHIDTPRFPPGWEGGTIYFYPLGNPATLGEPASVPTQGLQ